MAWVPLPPTQVEEARVVGGERQRRRQARALFAVGPEQLDVVEDAPLVGTRASPRIGLGHQREEITARALAHGRDHAMGVVALEQPERRLMVTDHTHHLLAQRERHAQAPQDGARQHGAAHRVAVRGDSALVIGARAIGLRHVVQERAREGHEPCFVVERTERGQRRHRLAHQPRVDRDVALRVVHRILRNGLQSLHPVEAIAQHAPGHSPIGRRRYLEPRRERRQRF